MTPYMTAQDTLYRMPLNIPDMRPGDNQKFTTRR